MCSFSRPWFSAAKKYISTRHLLVLLHMQFLLPWQEKTWTLGSDDKSRNCNRPNVWQPYGICNHSICDSHSETRRDMCRSKLFLPTIKKLKLFWQQSENRNLEAICQCYFVSSLEIPFLVFFVVCAVCYITQDTNAEKRGTPEFQARINTKMYLPCWPTVSLIHPQICLKHFCFPRNHVCKQEYTNPLLGTTTMNATPWA